MNTRGSPISESCTGTDDPFPEAITGGVTSLYDFFLRDRRQEISVRAPLNIRVVRV